MLIQNRDNEWIVEKEIKLRESKKQKGLVSFDLLHPVKRLMLIRTDGALTDDRNEYEHFKLWSYSLYSIGGSVRNSRWFLSFS